MPTFAVPWIFGLAVAAALGVVGLHLLSVRMPPELLLPTARFVPDGEARSVARQPRLNDVLLLLLRVLALLLVGAALAGVRWRDSRATLLRLVVADDAWQADTAWRDSVAAALARDEALVDVHFVRGVHDDPGAALVGGTERAVALTRQHRSLSRVELTVVTTPTVRTMQGYAAWRTQWPGPVRLIERVARIASDDTAPAEVIITGAAADDEVAAALARLGTVNTMSRTSPHVGSGGAVHVDRSVGATAATAATAAHGGNARRRGADRSLATRRGTGRMGRARSHRYRGRARRGGHGAGGAVHAFGHTGACARGATRFRSARHAPGACRRVVERRHTGGAGGRHAGSRSRGRRRDTCALHANGGRTPPSRE